MTNMADLVDQIKKMEITNNTVLFAGPFGTREDVHRLQEMIFKTIGIKVPVFRIPPDDVSSIDIKDDTILVVKGSDIRREDQRRFKEEMGKSIKAKCIIVFNADIDDMKNLSDDELTRLFNVIDDEIANRSIAI